MAGNGCPQLGCRAGKFRDGFDGHFKKTTGMRQNKTAMSCSSVNVLSQVRRQVGSTLLGRLRDGVDHCHRVLGFDIDCLLEDGQSDYVAGILCQGCAGNQVDIHGLLRRSHTVPSILSFSSVNQPAMLAMR